MALKTLSKVTIIAGPTASGKSDFALDLARSIGGEIVNADAAQMYARIAVGTAKPAQWRTSDVPHHLFDICGEPIHFDVAQYREKILAVVAAIQERGKMPILVGGSLFYIKSLFFPPHEVRGAIDAVPVAVRVLPVAAQWELLQSIDKVRAQQIHPHDAYRVMRALALFYESGQKPSTLAPRFTPPFPAHIIFLSPSFDVLYERINSRTISMFVDGGWVDEVCMLMTDPAWRSFVESKGFIGYQAIALWIEAGKPADAYPALVAHIQQETRNYAKRQRTFWRSFIKQLEEINSPLIECSQQ